jgi:actin-related protein
MDATQRPAVVIDCGTGYTKMGYAGNVEPSHIIPTAIAIPEGSTSATNNKVRADYEFRTPCPPGSSPAAAASNTGTGSAEEVGGWSCLVELRGYTTVPHNTRVQQLSVT